MACIIAIFLILQIQKADATHIKAGEITARLVGNSGVEFTMVLYLSTQSLNTLPELITDHLTAEFNFSDNRKPVIIPVTSITDLDGNTKQYVYTGRIQNVDGNLIVSYSKQNRNEGILNISNSIDVPFYIQTTLNNKIEPNNTLPRLTIPPIDEGATGVIFTHNPGATDINGDSISYGLTAPKSSKNNAAGYTPPELIGSGEAVGGGAAFARINPITGDFVWNAPAKEGLYNIAIEIKEWRKRADGRYSLLSTTVRDMQINIKENPNKRPEIIIPSDTCVEANVGTDFKATIKAYDPDSILPNNYQNIYLSATGLPAGASFNLVNPVSEGLIKNPGKAIFTWNAGCAAVRQQPYNVTFQAKDQIVPSRQLVTFKTWQIRVNGPRPQNLSIKRQVKGFVLEWDKYPCSNADSIIIYRKDCDTAKYSPEPCETKVPANFIKIGAVAVTDNLFLDSLNIVQGNQYNYILAATFKGIKAGKSVYSEASSVNTFYYEPLLTNISVINTDIEKGKILIRWLRPITALGNVYEYVLSRKSNSANDQFKAIYTTSNLADTSYIDSTTNLNTVDKQWIYQVELRKDGIKQSSTTTSTSVFLAAKPATKKILLSWSYNTAWDNTKFKHDIYRKKISEKVFVKWDSISTMGASGNYIDKNLSREDTFCYYIVTKGKYCADSLPRPLLNLSQEVCLSPSDSTKPCTPKLSLADENCDLPIEELLERPYKNQLSWVYTADSTCKTKLGGFNLFKAPDEDSEYKLLKFLSPELRSYTDSDPESQAACYAISAVSETGMEGDRSNVECNDNCVYYALPNLMTPNGDTINDKFGPLRFPTGVKAVKLYIYNRWGALVHYQESGPQLNWNPYEKDKDFTDGVYYYYAIIDYERRRNPKNNQSALKGWVHILSKANNRKE